MPSLEALTEGAQLLTKLAEDEKLFAASARLMHEVLGDQLLPAVAHEGQTSGLASLVEHADLKEALAHLTGKLTAQAQGKGELLASSWLDTLGKPGRFVRFSAPELTESGHVKFALNTPVETAAQYSRMLANAVHRPVTFQYNLQRGIAAPGLAVSRDNIVRQYYDGIVKAAAHAPVRQIFI